MVKEGAFMMTAGSVRVQESWVEQEDEVGSNDGGQDGFHMWERGTSPSRW